MWNVFVDWLFAMAQKFIEKLAADGYIEQDPNSTLFVFRNEEGDIQYTDDYETYLYYRELQITRELEDAIFKPTWRERLKKMLGMV